jgi:hypothetical protein
MSKRDNVLFVIVVLMFALLAGAAGHKASTRQALDKQAPSEREVTQLPLLMDSDKNGKISKEEYTSFMQAEFDRLDKDKTGELDPKALTESRFGK